jgi:hypothetical protein
MYFTNVGGKGPVRDGEYPFAIGVLEARDEGMPIGIAYPAGRTGDGLELWRLVVAGVEVAGRFVIVDRQFIEVR